MSEIKEGLKGVVAAQSRLSFIDGDQGILVYSGINIHELAEKATFEEVIYLLLEGRLPNATELKALDQSLKSYRQIPDAIFDLLRLLPKTSEPMDSLRTAVSALASYDTRPNDGSVEAQKRRVLQLTSQISIIVAAIQRLRNGQDIVPPHTDLGYSGNFLWMLNGKEPDATAIKAIDVAMVLHADHGFNASTFAARVTVSTLSDVYSGTTSAIGALKGPLHGGANQRVMEMLLDIDDRDPVEYIQGQLKSGKKIMGFGHRVYHTEDPRATHLRRMSEQLCLSTGNRKWFDISRRIEDFMKREKKLNANVDFYSASVYYTLGIPSDLFTLLFAMSRMSGWGAHMLEQYADNRLIRPREDYVGPEDQHYVPLSER